MREATNNSIVLDTIDEASNGDTDNIERTKRFAVGEDSEEATEKTATSIGKAKCRKSLWRCMSNVIEGSLDYMDKPDGLMG